ncbi:hypothetical protein TNCV_460441 [Trichonephila clavipes]|nr:hypothetical protein TNCV_460441 [Trichonephila clavipes]
MNLALQSNTWADQVTEPLARTSLRTSTQHQREDRAPADFRCINLSNTAGLQRHLDSSPRHASREFVTLTTKPVVANPNDLAGHFGKTLSSRGPHVKTGLAGSSRIDPSQSVQGKVEPQDPEYLGLSYPQQLSNEKGAV